MINCRLTPKNESGKSMLRKTALPMIVMLTR